ncbi:MAG: PilZ domain-containing protein [Nitrospirae bacterium]|nr:PilZ domain-containing protein [Nitrospirota bacterium]
MFIKGNVREYSRTPFVTPVRYSVSVMDVRELKKIQDTAVSVDISKGGLGMITGYPIETGHVLTFKDEIKINNITAKAAIVKWTGKIDSNKYRVGLKFV